MGLDVLRRTEGVRVKTTRVSRGTTKVWPFVPGYRALGPSLARPSPAILVTQFTRRGAERVSDETIETKRVSRRGFLRKAGVAGAAVPLAGGGVREDEDVWAAPGRADATLCTPAEGFVQLLTLYGLAWPELPSRSGWCRHCLGLPPREAMTI